MRFMTRLRIRMLWPKHTYSFYWAHKPLCARFAEDVLKLGTIYLCRSCSATYVGMFTGIALLSFTPESSGLFPMMFLAVLIGVLIFSVPSLYKRLPRFVRDMVRFASGILIPASVYLCSGPGYRIGILGLGALFLFWCVYMRMRKRRKLKECDGCPELELNRICSGFEMQANHIRRYQTEADELLAESGYMPECVVWRGQKSSEF